MDRLPQELVDQISKSLPQDDLKNTLLVSHSFRFAAEKYSGAFSSFAFHDSNAEKFIATFSGHRFQYLRSLSLTIVLPRVDYKYPIIRDSPEQLKRNDESFTRQIKCLFETLKSVEEHAARMNSHGKMELIIIPPHRPVAKKYRELAFYAYLSWRVHLLKPELLPELRSVRSFEFGDDSSDCIGCYTKSLDTHTSQRVKVDYRFMVDLVSCFPNLEYWGCRMGGDEWMPKWEQEEANYLQQDWPGPRRDTRQDFATALESAKLPDTLRRVRLDFMHQLDRATDIDHSTSQPNLVYPACYDPFSRSLHKLSQHLRRIHLRVVADESLFWPNGDHVTSWPILESFVVVFDMVSPSGKWYFRGPRGEGTEIAAIEVTEASYPPLQPTDFDEEMRWEIEESGDRRSRGSENDKFRIVPNDAILRPFLEAFANATARMSALQEAALWCPIAWQRDDYNDNDDEAAAAWLPRSLHTEFLAWGLHFLASGSRDYRRPGGRCLDTDYLYWRVGKWRPDPELHELFRQIGGNRIRNDLEEHWTMHEAGERLVGWDDFDTSTLEGVENLGRIPPPQ
ncbi:hypothetical protein IQ06DRAFT_251339 [Phaeosphaeriaceae sp. SRC1lsM3a]|nr:hypothetical protein IQ06DRAFT_251339 [Stagonospora sp. SRC1lsM3a]